MTDAIDAVSGITDEFEKDAESILKALSYCLIGYLEPATVLEHDQIVEADPKWQPDEALYFWARQVLRFANGLRKLDAGADNDKRIFVGIMLGRAAGFMYGGIDHYQLWLRHQESTKSGRKKAANAQNEMYKRMNVLMRYIIEHGPVPKKGEFGKTNPARTKYFQKFKRDTGATYSADSFYRYADKITQDDLDNVQRTRAEAAAARFLEIYAQAFCDASPDEQIKIFEQFKSESGFVVSIEQFEMYAEFQLSHPGLAVKDFASRMLPY